MRGGHAQRYTESEARVLPRTTPAARRTPGFCTAAAAAPPNHRGPPQAFGCHNPVASGRPSEIPEEVRSRRILAVPTRNMAACQCTHGVPFRSATVRPLSDGKASIGEDRGSRPAHRCGWHLARAHGVQQITRKQSERICTQGCGVRSSR